MFDFVGDAEKVILPEDAKKPIKTMEELAESVESQGFFPTVIKAAKTYLEGGTDEDEVGSPYKGWTNEQLIEALERLD